jgi:hypothetical protein
MRKLSYKRQYVDEKKRDEDLEVALLLQSWSMERKKTITDDRI